MPAAFQQRFGSVVVALRDLAICVTGGKVRGRELDVIVILGAAILFIGGAVLFVLVHTIDVNIRDIKFAVCNHFFYGKQRIAKQLLFLLAEGFAYTEGYLLPVQSGKRHQRFGLTSASHAFTRGHLTAAEQAAIGFVCLFEKESHMIASLLIPQPEVRFVEQPRIHNHDIHKLHLDGRIPEG